MNDKNSTNANLPNEKASTSNEEEAKEEEVMQYITMGDDFDVDDIIRFVDSHFNIDVEKDDTIANDLEKEFVVRVKRQLGHWVEVTVDAARKRITCNCEDYNADAFCTHCATFEVLQFGMMPNTKCTKSYEKWNEMRSTCIDKLKKTYVDINEDLHARA